MRTYAWFSAFYPFALGDSSIASSNRRAQGKWSKRQWNPSKEMFGMSMETLRSLRGGERGTVSNPDFKKKSSKKAMSSTRGNSMSRKRLDKRLDIVQFGGSIIGEGGIGYHQACSCSVRGGRPYMEDEIFIQSSSVPKRLFAGVFDGHGGNAISRYLRQNLYANFQAALPARRNGSSKQRGEITSHDCKNAFRSAFQKVDEEIQEISHWSFQGSTAVCILVHTSSVTNATTIMSANVGDSRAVLSRNRTALDLTVDHKPNSPLERARIEALGGRVKWCGLRDSRTGKPLPSTGVYRINGNLAVSRAMGDRSERPWVTSEADINQVDLLKNDSFVVLGSDGLWDVMTSQQVIDFVHDELDRTEKKTDLIDNDTNLTSACMENKYKPDPQIRDSMSQKLVDEALRKGSTDNISVIVIWLDSD